MNHAGKILRIIAAMAVGAILGGLIAQRFSLIGVIALLPLGVMLLAALTHGLGRSSDDPEASARLLRWTLASFALHLVVGFVIIGSHSLRLYLGGDSFTYHQGALGILDHWKNGVPAPTFSAGKEGYYYLLAGLYFIFGPSTWAGVALNALFGAALVPLTADTTRRLFGSAAARYAPLVMVLTPGLILWPAQLLKEAPFLVLLALAANSAVRLAERFSPWPLLVLALSLPAMLAIRGQLALAIVGGLIIGIVFSREHVVGGAIGAVVATALVAGVITLGVGSSGYQSAVSTNLQQANQVRQGLSQSTASGFETDADISTVNHAVTFLPIGLTIVSVGPFPWQLAGARQLVVIPDVIAWWLYVAAIWWSRTAARRIAGRGALVLVIPAITMLGVLSLVVGNYGTLVRERMGVLVLLAPLVALGISVRWPRPEPRQDHVDADVAVG